MAMTAERLVEVTTGARRAGAERVRDKMQRIADLNAQKKMIALEIKLLKGQLQKEAARVGGTLILDDDMLICLDGAPVQLNLSGDDDADPEE